MTSCGTTKRPRDPPRTGRARSPCGAPGARCLRPRRAPTSSGPRCAWRTRPGRASRGWTRARWGRRSAACALPGRGEAWADLRSQPGTPGTQPRPRTAGPATAPPLPRARWLRQRHRWPRPPRSGTAQFSSGRPPVPFPPPLRCRELPLPWAAAARPLPAASPERPLTHCPSRPPSSPPGPREAERGRARTARREKPFTGEPSARAPPPLPHGGRWLAAAPARASIGGAGGRRGLKPQPQALCGEEGASERDRVRDGDRSAGVTGCGGACGEAPCGGLWWGTCARWCGGPAALSVLGASWRVGGRVGEGGLLCGAWRGPVRRAAVCSARRCWRAGLEGQPVFAGNGGVRCGGQSWGSQGTAAPAPDPHGAPFLLAAARDAMAQALASPGLFSDDDAAAASPVLESTATGFGSDVRKDLLSEFSAISPSLEGSQQVRLDVFRHKQGSVLTRGCRDTVQSCSDAEPMEPLPKRLEQNGALGEAAPVMTSVLWRGQSLNAS